MCLCLVQILPWSEDSDGAVWIEGEQVLVAGDDTVRAAGYGTLQDEVVLRIAADARDFPGDDDSNTFFKKLAQLLTRLLRIAGKLLVHDPHNFVFQFRACEDVVFVQTMCDRRQGNTATADGGYPNARVKDDDHCLAACFKAHCSARSSSTNLSMSSSVYFGPS